MLTMCGRGASQFVETLRACAVRRPDIEVRMLCGPAAASIGRVRTGGRLGIGLDVVMKLRLAYLLNCDDLETGLEVGKMLTA